MLCFFGRRWFAFAVMLVGVLILGAIACSGSTSTSVTPTTGILVRAETLTTGRGCGKNPTQLFKYAVVVFAYKEGPPEDPKSYADAKESNVFDCFADGTFVNLTPSAGNSTYRLEVYAYNEPAYSASRADIETAGTDFMKLRSKTTPTWTTECTATQQQQVLSLAVCRPLAPGLSGLGPEQPLKTEITLGTTRFKLADGRLATCATTPPPDAGADDAASDASTDAGVDASDATADAGPAPDGGPPVFFTTAKIRYRVGAIEGPTVDVTCPAPYVAAVAAEPQQYDIDVGLLDSAGNALGQTVCTVTSLPGVTSTAVCP